MRIALVAVITIVAVAVLNSDRGVPLALLILLAFVVGFEYVAKRTRFGRHVYAVGGNAEAARRAGIGVDKIRVAVFALSGTMAAIGGILAASRLLAVNQSSGGSELLLLAIAGPVIAGTSLFGGRGAVWTALLGALVIGSISNGMDLLALSSAVKFMVTGGVLLLAVIVDAIARQQRQPPAGQASSDPVSERRAARRRSRRRGRRARRPAPPAGARRRRGACPSPRSAAPCSARRSGRRGRRR